MPSRRLSFAGQLAIFWVLVAALCAVLLGLLGFMANANGARQLDLARQSSLAGCQSVASRYDASAEPSQPASSDLMHAILDIVLAHMEGVEGGFWRIDLEHGVHPTARGTFEVYAFPTYPGSGVKRDIPEAETPLILRTLQKASMAGRATSATVAVQNDAIVVAACPVAHHAGLFVWSLARAHAPLGANGLILLGGLAGLLALLVASAVWLGVHLRRWRAGLARIEVALATRDARFAPMSAVGTPDLDRIVFAFNAYGEQAAALERQSLALRERLGAAERFAALGRLAAEVAHEIRNPIGAMRLKAENALVGERDRKDRALAAILEQIARVETQLAALLALTRPIRISAEPVALPAWLRARVELHGERAQRARVTLTCVYAGEDTVRVCIDAEQLARAVDNLLVNALRHTPALGEVTLCATVSRETLRIEVLDTGPGVAVTEHKTVFDPFVTGHAAGTGLGLAVVREIAIAHGGRAFIAPSERGARFVIEVPCQSS
ncbi:HAMP domain-containing sensor histidine kinase [Robbsia sp. Bb-Pol-6]|uniref:histidine kinase n=1 Tax=Robbsia betulipollinis TaxID=2981849 RepID=A0ABT3ZQA3_9BURK|nr:HAMP domain-containing sensor histidine kinase [Robbsia betulipollinis]MCY0388738.1 HAMP domain-containing sensor histidine kinase [Robbsia betulipollinis]